MILNKLLEVGIFSSTDLDTRNQTPHVELKRHKDDIEGQSLYNRLNNHIYSISINSFNFRDNYLDLDMGYGKHFTLIYKSNLIIHRELILSILDLYLPLCSYKDEENKDDEKSSLCTVCYDKPKDCLIKPCKHFCVCMVCADKLLLCPVCRSSIQTKEKIYD